MKVFKQVTNHGDIVNIAIEENLDKSFWKRQNYKEFNRVVKEDKKNTLQAIVELPKFEMYVRKHEILWDKNRSNFSVLEKEYVDRAYHNLSN